MQPVHVVPLTPTHPGCSSGARRPCRDPTSHNPGARPAKGGIARSYRQTRSITHPGQCSISREPGVHIPARLLSQRKPRPFRLGGAQRHSDSPGGRHARAAGHARSCRRGCMYRERRHERRAEQARSGGTAAASEHRLSDVQVVHADLPRQSLDELPAAGNVAVHSYSDSRVPAPQQSEGQRRHMKSCGPTSSSQRPELITIRPRRR